MIAVIFEVEPASDQHDTYLDLIARLKLLLERMDGFISIGRSQSITNPDEILSLSFFRDEEAVKAWRNLEQHRSVQHVGYDRAFADYHLRVAHVIRDYDMTNRDGALTDNHTEHI